MKPSLFFKITFSCLFLNVYSLFINENNIIKNKLLNLNDPQEQKIADFKKCLFKEASEKIKQLLLLRTNRNDYIETTESPNHNVIDNPLKRIRISKRQVQQNMIGLDKPEINWDKCVIKSELEEHKLLEHEHIMAIKDEVVKLRELIQLLQDQQYILSIMQNFEDHSKSKDLNEQEQLKQLLFLLRGESQKGKTLDQPQIPVSTEANVNIKETTKSKSVNISTVIEELEQLKKLIYNLQDDRKEEKLKQEIEIQRKEINKLKETIKKAQKLSTTTQTPTTNTKMRLAEEKEEMGSIQEELLNLKHKLSNYISQGSNSSKHTDETNSDLPSNILGASLSKFKLLHSNNRTHPESISRKAKSDNEDDDMESLLNLLNEEKPKSKTNTEINNMQKKLKNLMKESNKKSSVLNLKGRADSDDFFDDFQKLLDNSDSNSDLDLNFNDDLENKLSSLQKQLEIQSKLKKLEKKINQLHSAESKGLDDQDEDDLIKKKIKKIEKQLKKLNKAEGKDTNDEEDIVEQLKSLQSDINKLKPKDDDEDFENSQGKDGTASIQVALNKLLHGGKKVITKPVVSNKLHLSPTQIQLLKKKIISMKQGNSYDHASNGYGSGYLPYGGTFPHYGHGSDIHYGHLGGNVYGDITNQGSNYGLYASLGKYGYGKYGSSSGPYGQPNNKNNYANALYSLLNTQYGSVGPYGSGSGKYGSTGGSYGPGSSAYGSNADTYELDKNQYSPQGYGSQSSSASYGQGSGSGSYQLKSLYDKVYGLNHPYSAGSESYGSSGKKYGLYGPSNNPYGSESPYGLSAASGQYGSIPNLNDIENYLYSSNMLPYSSANEKYAFTNNDAASYSSANIYGNKYGPGNSPYKSGGESYSYGAPKLDKSTNRGQLKNQKYDANGKQYGPLNQHAALGYNNGKEQYLNENNNYGVGNNNQQYGQTIKDDQYGTNSANLEYLNDISKPYKDGSNQNKYTASDSGYSSQTYTNSNPHTPDSTNAYADGNVHKPPFPEPYINVHNIFEHLAHGYQDQKPPFFPSYDSEYQSNSENYQSSANTNLQNSEQSYAYGAQAPAVSNAYAQQKVKDLKTQIYTLQNVINNLNRPEYTQKPEDKEMVYKLDKKISDLKSVVSHLSQDVPYSGGPSSKPEYRQSNLDDKSSFKKKSHIGKNFLHTQRRKRETNVPEIKEQKMKPHNTIHDILRQLGDVVNIIQSFKGELSDDQDSKSNIEAENNHQNEFVTDDQKQINKREDPKLDDVENEKLKSKKSNAVNNFLQQLSDVMEVITYFSQNSAKINNDSSESLNQDQNSTVQFQIDNNNNDTRRQIRQTIINGNENENTKISRLLKRLIDLSRKINYLAQDVTRNSCICTSGKMYSNNETINENQKAHNLRKRQINESDEEEDDDNDNNNTKLFFDKISSFFKGIFNEAGDNKENDNVIEKQATRQNQYAIRNQEHLQNSQQKLQRKLEELKKQLDSKLYTNMRHHQLPIHGHKLKSPLYNNNLHASSHTNPNYRSSYYPQPSYYPTYYKKPQYYYYPEPSYESKDKKGKIKLKIKSKKNDIMDKIFSKILDKIIDKVTEAIPKITRRIFGLGVEKVLNYDKDDYGYGEGGYDKGQSGYGYQQNTYAMQQNFKNMGLFGYIPLIILKLLTNLTSFVRQLQKNRFIKTFLVPALVTAGTAGMVVFLVWWLTGDDNYHHENYGNKYEYSGNYGNSYRSNTVDNVDNDLYNRNNNYNREDYYDRRQDGLVRDLENKNKEFKSINANNNYNQENSIDNYVKHHYRDDDTF